MANTPRGLLDFIVPQSGPPQQPFMPRQQAPAGLLSGYMRPMVQLADSQKPARPKPREISPQKFATELREQGVSFRADLKPEEWLPVYTRLFNDPAVFDQYRAQVKQVVDRAMETGLEEAIIRVYQAPDGYVKSMIVPGKVADDGVGVDPPPWDKSQGTLLFEGHPHPSGDLARASPKDLGTSLRNGGIPSVIWYRDGKGNQKEYWYRGRPRD